MPVGYHHLTHAERCQIHALLHRGWSKREIARDLGRDPATISRETSRHCGQRGYRHQPADGKAVARRQEASAVPRQMTPERWAVVEDRLQEGWSPEQIAGWVRLPGEGMAGKEWIYRTYGPVGTRYRCLRRRGQKPNGRSGRQWTGARSSGSWSGSKARRPPQGTEAITQKLNAGFSFATPYPSWERSRNEHPNGRVCQYFPKGTDCRQVTAAQVRAMENRLHHRPRKVLGVRTPAEVSARGLAPPGRGPWSPVDPGTPGPSVIHRSGFARPPGPERTLALADGFGQDRQPSRWLPSVAEKKRSKREFLGRRRDPCLRATPSFRGRGAVALRTGPGGGGGGGGGGINHSNFKHSESENIWG